MSATGDGWKKMRDEFACRFYSMLKTCGRTSANYSPPIRWSKARRAFTWSITASVSGKAARRSPEVDLILCTAGLPAHSADATLGVAEHARHAASPLAGVKTTSWLNNVWHLAEAQKAGWTEVILLNERAEVAECTSANIFCVNNGEVFTPPISSGCLEGVTRSFCWRLRRGQGISMSEKTLTMEDLYHADEVFITSTNRTLLGVSEIMGHRSRW